ncbi:Gem-associated protein 2 [Rhynchospora pubera]|uniref:Gem-associated protein 2 n=1 Tax=Rhynchospora pubera TaxID=906938 RepID=A0AAV8HSZ6_9POAL|nr:Gem-associated protein 2 [Rhynchospora pubera]
MESNNEEMEATTLVSLRDEETKGHEKGPQRKYTRSDMEALRFVQSEYQLELFERVYWGLEPTVRLELDGIFVADSNKKKKRNRNRNKNKQRNRNNGGGDIGMIIYFHEEMSFFLSFQLSTVFTTFAASEEQLVAGTSNQSGMGENMQCEEDDISDDSYDGILKPAFLVEGEPDFESGPPVDGWEYLRRVRWEADQLPDVKVAKLNLNEINAEQTPYMPKIPDLPKCPTNLLPSKKWEDYFLNEFSELRKAFSQLSSSLDPSNSSPISKSSIEDQSQVAPTVATILNMDAVHRAATLRNYIDMAESLEKLSRHDCLWLFALCATVDMPLHADTCASLRCLLRKCLGILATKLEMDDEVAMLSVLVSICGKYFGQYDNTI